MPGFSLLPAPMGPDIITARLLRKCCGKALFWNVLDVVEENKK